MGKFSTSTPILCFLSIPRLFLDLAPTSFKISYLIWHDSVLNAIPAFLSSIHNHSADALTLYTGLSALRHKDADSLVPSFQVPAASSAFSSYKLDKEINNSSFFNVIFFFFFPAERVYTLPPALKLMCLEFVGHVISSFLRGKPLGKT